jgi:hypothetical protein
MPTRRTKALSPASLSLFPVAETRDPEVLDVQATANMLGISTHAVYALSRRANYLAAKWRAAG